jgi:hypothetical protein
VWPPLQGPPLEPAPLETAPQLYAQEHNGAGKEEREMRRAEASDVIQRLSLWCATDCL